MNRFAVLALLALCLPLAAHADDASRHAKAQELVALLHTDHMVKQVADNINKQISDAAEKVTGPDASAESKAKLSDFEKKVADMIDAQVGWKVMEPEFISIYEKTYTEEEIDGIIAFYKSPAGLAFLQKTPTINSQISQLTQPRLTTLQTEVRQAFQDFQKSQTPAAPAGPPTLGAPAAGPTK
jgi:hypothetical protein